MAYGDVWCFVCLLPLVLRHLPASLSAVDMLLMNLRTMRSVSWACMAEVASDHRERGKLLPCCPCRAKSAHKELYQYPCKPFDVRNPA